ncbi:uncharacterized protein LOC144178683 [Haemaphysalis longicornis]
MDRANLPRFFLVQFLGLWCLQLSEPPGVRVACPATVDTVGLPFTGRLSTWKADEAAATHTERPRASRSTQPPHFHWPYLVTSWRCRTYLEPGTSCTAHAFNLDIKLARIVAAFSGLGSTAMDRANLPRFFLVQVTNRYCLFAKRTSYRALVVLPSPHWFCTFAYDCTNALVQLILLAGDVETNPGPDSPHSSDSDDVSSQMLKALKELQSGQSAMLEQLKAIQTTLVEHEKTFREMKERLDKIESDHASLETMRPLLTGLQSDADSNAHHIKVLTARINDSENRSRRNNLLITTTRGLAVPGTGDELGERARVRIHLEVQPSVHTLCNAIEP